MGLLRNTKCYLAGPIEYADDKRGGVVWRNELTPKLEDLGVRIYDPMRKPLWYPEITKGDPGKYVKQVINAKPGEDVRPAFDAIKFIEKADFRYIYDCEWVIVYLPKTFTVGTIDEIRAAVDAGKPIFVVSPDMIPSSWLMGMVATPETWKEVFFRSMDDCLEHIKRIDKGQVALDPLPWIFLSYFNASVPLKNQSEWKVRA